MCAALAARKDPAEELEFAVVLLNRVIEGFTGVRIGLHVCRGNWSRDETTLLRGTYEPLRPYFERMNVDQLVLEYATERAGDLIAFEGKELGLGVVNPRTEAVETVDDARGDHRPRARALPDRAAVPQSRLRIRHLRQPPDEQRCHRNGQGREDVGGRTPHPIENGDAARLSHCRHGTLGCSTADTTRQSLERP